MANLSDLQAALVQCNTDVDVATAAVTAARNSVTALIAAIPAPPPPIDYSSEIATVTDMDNKVTTITANLNQMIAQITAAIPH